MASSETSEETTSQLLGEPLLLELRDEPSSEFKVGVFMQDNELQPYSRRRSTRTGSQTASIPRSTSSSQYWSTWPLMVLTNALVSTK
jgi:hypothetical protein